MKRVGTVLSVLLLAACATPKPESTSTPDEPTQTEAKPQREFKSQPLKHLAGRNLKPMPDKELDVRARCSFKDVQGGRGSMDLDVRKAEVKRFVAEVDIPKQGLCRFDLKTFEQTARMPNVVLTDSDSSCVVRMWEQPSGKKKGVTVSFNSCQAKCGGDAFSYLWPILVDAQSGRCS